MDPPRSSLCPGYTYVSSFSPDLSSPKSKNAQLDQPQDASIAENEAVEEEYEEEVEYVVLDLGNIEPTLVPSSSSYRLIGLDTPTPFLQLSGTILRGRHEDLLGSELIFTDDKDSSSAASGQKKRGVTHVSTTSKRIAFKEVNLRPKDKTASPPPAQTQPVTGISEGAGPEGPDTMDVDDALEYVDLNIDPILRGPAGQPQADPSRIPPVSLPQRSPSPPFDPSAPITSFTASITIGKGKTLPLQPPAPHSVEETPSDPMLRIDRLTGISPPLTRAPRGSKKASQTPAAEMAIGSTTGKGKQKAKAAAAHDEGRMDTAED